MHNYNQILNRMQKMLAGHYLENNQLLNIPGKSLACKIDPFYYLSPQPYLIQSLSTWCGITPELAGETLIRTGYLIADKNTGRYTLDIGIVWQPEMQPVTIKASFLLADFIDTALRIFAHKRELIPVSELKVASREQEKITRFFEGKTPLNKLAYAHLL